MEVKLYDTTLRDGAQREGISFSLEDKIKIARKLDAIGIHYIEGGYGGSNPKDMEFFARMGHSPLRHAEVVAFGNTRRAGVPAQEDLSLREALATETRTVTLVAKASLPQVLKVLRTTPEENLAMVTDSIRFLRSKGRRVLFDAEHFFDGYIADPQYALQVLKAAEAAGAELLCLCDTNGGTLTSRLIDIIRRVKGAVGIPLGIHAHNDTGVAVANTLAAVEEGLAHVQGTVNGYGERCGNANLCTIIPNLVLKMGIQCVSDGELAQLTELSRYVSEIANLSPDPFAPFVGQSAFVHKGGLHADGVAKWEDSYQHISPEVVGNFRRILVSELSGRSAILSKAKELGLKLPPQGPEVGAIRDIVKKLEARGFQFEGAEASLELLIHRSLPGYSPPFQLLDFLVLVEKRTEKDILAEATIKVKVGDQVMHTAAEGNGPVNALDMALRKALISFYPVLNEVRLTDYKVRILNEDAGTEAQTRVLIETTDGHRTWSTVGSSTNIIEASWFALADSLEYTLIKNGY